MTFSKILRSTVLVLTAVTATGCATGYTRPDFPVTFESEILLEDSNKPRAQRHTSSSLPTDEEIQMAKDAANNRTMGSTFSKASYKSLFEDKRARNVGDLLTVDIIEQTAASQNKNTDLSRDDTASISVPQIKDILRGITGNASANRDFSGGGSTSASSQFVGTITVSVVRVLPNGNLLIAGEKQTATNNDLEMIRLSGVVDPDTILAGNRVLSSSIADARVQYTGRGAVDQAQSMGWLSRIFLTVLPF